MLDERDATFAVAMMPACAIAAADDRMPTHSRCCVNYT
jgi:hypothetical protein